MKLIVSSEVREKYPDLRIGIILVKNLDNRTYQEGLEEFCKKSFLGFARGYESHKELAENKNIIAWRDVYRSFGVNPRKKKPTAESLLVRTIKSGFVPHISPAVDAYLCAETKCCLPIGGYDLTKISGDIVLRFARADELFVGVGETDPEPCIEGEVVYADNTRILTRCWNYKDCDYAKIVEDTNTVALFTEAPLDVITQGEVTETLESMKYNLEKYCGASCEISYLGSDTNEIGIMAVSE